MKSRKFESSFIFFNNYFRFRQLLLMSQIKVNSNLREFILAKKKKKKRIRIRAIFSTTSFVRYSFEDRLLEHASPVEGLTREVTDYW